MRYIYIALIGAFSITSCNNSTSSSGTSDAGNTPAAAKLPVESKLNEAGTQALMGTVTRYYDLKNAFVATKAARVDSAATDLTASAEQMQATLQKDSVNMPALKLYVDSVVAYSKMINTIKDETCEQQRILFEVISRNMYVLLKHAAIKNAHIYHEYCPMAFNDKGAYWLSGESEILNPYFGKKMLECGEVTDSM
ncbi:MAG: hypothetical protein JWQ38_96 [Flavipsychrobacter sp.]|nr:hypothetical protein [Flavipsychrobacter sp.]